jgi:hypothetical protein
VRLHRGKECAEERAFTDETGGGTEWAAVEGGPWVIRECASRIVSADERAAVEAAARTIADSQRAADEREAIYQLQRAAIAPATLAAKVAEVKAARAVAIEPSPILKEEP